MSAVLCLIIASFISVKTLPARIGFSFDFLMSIAWILPPSKVTAAITSPCLPTPAPSVVTGAAMAGMESDAIARQTRDLFSVMVGSSPIGVVMRSM